MKYESRHERDTCGIGFAPGQQNIVIYLAPGILENAAALKKIG